LAPAGSQTKIARRLGVSHYMTKPVDEDAFLRQIGIGKPSASN